jgi:hypothetical protein
MGIHRGSNIIRSGLEFAFDTGYSSTFDNSSNYLHNKGEPTTNLYTNSDFSNGETGWTFGSWSNNAVTHTATTVTGPHGKQVSANKLYMGVNGGAVHFHQYNGSKYTSGNTYTTSAWVKGQGTFQIKSHWGGNTSFTMTGDWQRVSMTVTATTSTNGNFPYFAGEGLTVGSTFYITDTQTELGSHATPYIYSSSSNGTRSATNSLLDITKQYDINVSNASFDSDAHIDLDGTGDYLSLGSDITFKTNGGSGGWTVESVVKYDSVAGGYNNSTSPANFIGASGASYNSWYWSVLNSKLALWNISPGVWKYGSTTLAADTWYHTVLTCFGDGSSYQMYLNGNAEGGDHVSYSWNTSYSGLKVQYFGAGDTSRRYVNGKLPITRIYNRALSAVEVKQNFNAYKDRFNM